MNRKTMWVWALAIVGAVGVEAAAGKINSELMSRDLRIMEGILEEILGDGDSSLPAIPAIWGDSRSTRVQGTYYDGYGVLFLVEGSQVRHRVRVHVDRIHGGDRDIVRIKAKDYRRKIQTGEQAQTRAGVPDGPGTASTEELASIQKERLVEFLNSYAGAIRQLKPEDRITIRVNPAKGVDFTHAGPFALHGMSGIHELGGLSELHELGDLHALVDSAMSEMGDMPLDMEGVRVETEAAVKKLTAALGGFANSRGEPVPGLTATILKKDVDAHQGTDALKGKIRFEEATQEAKTGRDIQIFKGILGSALKGDHVRFGGSSQPSGFYQQGIGAVFFLTHDSSTQFAWASGNVFARVIQAEDEGEVNQKFRSTLIEVVADYGTTLKSVKDDEHIVINVKLTRHGRGRKGPSSATLKVRKRDVRDYDRGKISLEALEKRAEWLEL